ncbi:TIGR01620 family protein [Ferrimonas lipolytica]|uniref:TIGR01620 family protein n=1 Tax=Ferrimonas lipolytica TaxID=2724191 RepID=A0A6H1UB69_9GAMM|nr:TIGR01620 family protein [Ferrimonas lipolytica]QIZ75830.1 TIGR01620 family protein [Ferrimonas lipolytica]
MSKLKAAKEFDIDAVDANAPLEPTLSPAQDIDETQWRQALEPEMEIEAARPKRSLLLRLVLIAVTVLVVAETGWSLWQAWLRGPIWFGLYGVTIGGAVLLLGGMLLRELRRLRQLKRNGDQRQAGLRISASAQSGEAQQLLKQISSTVPAEFAQATEHWRECQQAHHNDSEQLQLYERTVLQQQDEAAQRCIYRYAAQASLLLAASPMASLDMGLMLWRNQTMLDQVARIYGIEPGYWSRIKLIRQMLKNLLFAGGSQVALDLGTQMLSAELTGKLSARVAQGLGAGLLTARLGYAACSECRPLPYQSQSQPSLLTVQGKLLSELKSVSAEALQSVRAHKQRNEQFTK